MAFLQERSEIERNEAISGRKVNTREYLWFFTENLLVSMAASAIFLRAVSFSRDSSSSLILLLNRSSSDSSTSSSMLSISHSAIPYLTGCLRLNVVVFFRPIFALLEVSSMFSLEQSKTLLG